MFNLRLSAFPLGNSKTLENFGFHTNILLGFKFLIIFTLFRLSKIIISKGFFTKNVCIPNLVLRIKAFLLNIIAPKVYSLRFFKSITSTFILVPRVEFVTTNLLYITGSVYKKGV